MSDLTTITINVYPWAVPTEAQKAMFDALSDEEKQDMIQKAIENGFSSGVSHATISDIIREAKAQIHG